MNDVTARIAGAVGTTSVVTTQSAGLISLSVAEIMGQRRTEARDVINSPNYCSPLVAQLWSVTIAYIRQCSTSLAV